VPPRKHGIRGPTTTWIVQRTQAIGDRRPTRSTMAFLHTRRASTSGHVSDVPLYIHFVDRKIYPTVATAHISPRRQPAQLPRFTPLRARGPGPEPFFVRPEGPTQPTLFGCYFSGLESSQTQDRLQSEPQGSLAIHVERRSGRRLDGQRKMRHTSSVLINVEASATSSRPVALSPEQNGGPPHGSAKPTPSLPRWMENQARTAQHRPNCPSHPLSNAATAAEAICQTPSNALDANDSTTKPLTAQD